MTKIRVSKTDLVAKLRKGDQVTAIDDRERGADMVLTIVERWNGSGFPYKLPNGIKGTLYPDTHVEHTVTVERPAPRPRKPTTRTIDGLTVVSKGEKWWETLDGRFQITYQEQGFSECEHGHPIPGGYCHGGETHAYYGWQVWDVRAMGGNGEYTYDIRNIETFSEAVSLLAGAIRPDTEG